MSLFDKIKNSLSEGAPEPLVLPDSMVFSALDISAISSKLKIQDKAVENGLKNLPEPDAKTFDSVEESIQNVILNEIRPNLQNYDSQQLAYKNRLASLDPFGLAARYRGEIDLQKNQLKIKIDQESGNLFLVKEALVQIENDWKSFKDEWGLKADPKAGFSLQAKWGFLVLMILAETIMNGFLIGPYVGGGLVEGLTIALIFPLLTLLFFAYPAGLMLRLLLRPKHSINKNYFIMGALSLVILALTLNLFLAYIREAVEIDGEWSSGMGFWLSTLTGDFYPLSSASFLLFLFSTALFILAVIDVYKMDHPVPGLLDKLKDRDDRHKEYRNKLKRAHQEIITLQKDASSDFRGVYDMLNSWQIEYNNIQGHQIKLWQKLQGYISHVEKVSNSLLKEYREGNSKSRTSPAPTYFREEWEFPLIDYKLPVVTEANGNYSERLNKALQEIELVQKSLNDVFGEIPNVLKGIDSLLYEVK